MLKQFHSLFAFFILFILYGPAIAQHSMTIEPLSAVTNSDGSELVANFLFTYSDGFQEVVELHVDDSGFSTPGGVRTDPVDLFAFTGIPTSGGSWGSGEFDGGELPPPYIQGAPEVSAQLTDDVKLEDGETQGAGAIGAVVITGLACGGGWLFARAGLSQTCAAQGQAVETMSIGNCGIFGESSVTCTEIPEPPPPPTELDMWSWYGNNGFPASWTAPSQWGWPNNGPFQIHLLQIVNP